MPSPSPSSLPSCCCARPGCSAGAGCGRPDPVEQLAQFYAVYGSVINFIGINALLALSLNVTLSAGMLSLGNAAFAAIGGYTAGILSLHFKLPFVVSLAGGTCAAGLVGLVIGLPVL